MFRFLRRRGKAEITSKLKAKLDDPVTAGTPEMTVSTTSQVLKPVFLVSAFIGYTHPSRVVLGWIGGLIWLVMLLSHGALDFLAARQVYTYGWASVSISLVLLCFICTIFSNRKVLPWLEKGLSRLEENKKYPKTFKRFEKVFKWLPLFVALFGLFCGAGIYVCLYIDDTLDVKFNLASDKPEVPDYVLIMLKVVRFLSGCYVMSALALFWSLAVCVMHMTGYSMIEFHREIREHLMNRESPITFRQAVISFTERGKFVQKSASACRVSLATLLVYSIASLAVNAFLFLYKTRHSVFPIYALLPSVSAIYPLCMAAWVTKQYSWYLAVVVKAWAERPESSSEEEDEPQVQRKGASQRNPKRGQSLWKRVSSARRGGNKPILKETCSLPLASQSETSSGVEDITKSREYMSEHHLAAPTLSMSDTEITDDEKTAVEGPKEKEPKRSRRELMDIVLRGAARAVGKLRHNAKRPKFNFEKYISYLQNVLNSVGFDIMGIVVTWNMVSTIIFLEVSVLALFVQESIFGNSKATVTL